MLKVQLILKTLIRKDCAIILSPATWEWRPTEVGIDAQGRFPLVGSSPGTIGDVRFTDRTQGDHPTAVRAATRGRTPAIHGGARDRRPKPPDSRFCARLNRRAVVPSRVGVARVAPPGSGGHCRRARKPATSSPSAAMTDARTKKLKMECGAPGGQSSDCVPALEADGKRKFAGGCGRDMGYGNERSSHRWRAAIGIPLFVEPVLSRGCRRRRREFGSTTSQRRAPPCRGVRAALSLWRQVPSTCSA